MHLFLRCTLFSAFAVLVSAQGASSQVVGGESAYKLAPAITGDRGRVFVGTQRGVILIGTSTSSEVIVTDSLVRVGAGDVGAVLPSELLAVWHLSMPNRVSNPDLIVGLASYDDGGTIRYGVLRSTDFGVSWTLIKDAAVGNPMFIPTNDFWAYTTLREMKWLPDAMHGWIYGPKGMVATTDGGLTWDVRYAEGRDSNFHVQALAFRDPMNGVATIGWAPIERFYSSSDGGETWIPRGSPLGVNRINQIDWIGNEYRALGFDRSALSNRSQVTTYLYKANAAAEFWEVKPKGNFTVEQTYHTELLWVNDQSGVMIMRSGEIFGTTNGGTTFTRVQDADSVGYPMRVAAVGTRRGFGYASITLDGTKIVQASTISQDGTLYRLVQWNLVTSGIDDEARVVLNAVVLPTPARDRARLVLDQPLSPRASVSIVDAVGRIAHVLTVESGTRSIVIDLATLSSGHYRIVVDDDNRRIVAPLLINR